MQVILLGQGATEETKSKIKTYKDFACDIYLLQGIILTICQSAYVYAQPVEATCIALGTLPHMWAFIVTGDLLLHPQFNTCSQLNKLLPPQLNENKIVPLF